MEVWHLGHIKTLAVTYLYQIILILHGNHLYYFGELGKLLSTPAEHLFIENYLDCMLDRKDFYLSNYP